MTLTNYLQRPSRAVPSQSSQHINPYRIATTAFCLLPSAILAEDATSSKNQFSAPFTDQTTGLAMERFFGARTSFAFAFALPPKPPPVGTAGSFIGQMTFPLKSGIGWGALGLIGDMDDNFILAAWPDGKGGVMASFRQATDEDNPPEVKGAFSVKPIPGPDGSGVTVNATSLTYTFLCDKCLDSTLGLGPEKIAQGSAVMGWALSEQAPRGDASDPGARLGFHERGFGPFTARLKESMTSGFDAVAATVAGAKAVPASARAVNAVSTSGGKGGGGGGDGADSDDDSGDESDDDD